MVDSSFCNIWVINHVSLTCWISLLDIRKLMYVFPDACVMMRVLSSVLQKQPNWQAVLKDMNKKQHVSTKVDKL